ncbi:MAG: hypothetical protein GY698_00845 [Actinomycetia bacterium]|nr:hypothetical protein [Actinomycetes bacterium]
MAGWQRARIIPVSGIANDTEAEQRATSALLAVLSIVRPFSKAVLTPMGASKADRALVETFIETTFKDRSGAAVRPDGLIRITYGSKAPFVALVEVKTGNSKLGADQINSYWDIARQEGFDAVLTISNEIAPSPGVHPTDGLKQKTNSKVKVHHLSWTRLLTMAVTEKVHRGVDDPEQDWILGELIRYLEHDASGAMDFDDMGPNWTAVRDGARDGTLTARSEGVEDIVIRWDQLLGYISLRLGADIGEDVTELVPRAEQQDPKLRTRNFVDSLSNTGTLAGTLRVPGTAGDLDVVVDLKARQNIVSVDIDAPSDKGARGRVSWLVRQLADAPANLVIESYAKGAQNGIAGPLQVVRDDPTVLIGPNRKDPHRFRLIARTELGQNRRNGRKPGFAQSTVHAVESFYGDVLQHVTPYQRKAPQLRPSAPETTAPDLPTVPLVDAVPSEHERGAIPMPAAPSTWPVISN